MTGGFSNGKDLSMSLKRKLLGLAVLASLATVAFVVVTASANNREGNWITPGVGAADITGLQSLNHIMEFSLEGIGANGITCGTSEWDTTTSAEKSKFLKIIPKLANCKTTSAGAVTINVNGCSLELYVAIGTISTTEQTADITCPAGVSMEIIDASCTVTIGTQTNLTGITYKDITPFETGVTGTFNVKLAVKADGATCPKGITGGKLSGGLIFEAFDTKVLKKLVPLEVK
jgi:hypothetical protein